MQGGKSRPMRDKKTGYQTEREVGGGGGGYGDCLMIM